MRYLDRVAWKRCVVTTAQEAGGVRRLLLNHGENRVSDLLDLDRVTLLRLAAQLPVTPRTLSLFRDRYTGPLRSDKL